ncbi:MAG: DUF4458 domain-containing protein, partial [Bacteroidales bacterium]|nr:DUF4458 domain-containing protein [Bacteroidales bacterium]
MKFKNLLLLSMSILIAVGVFFSCQEEEIQIKGEITFNIGKLTQANLKSLNDLDSADHVLVTITDELGNPTDYTLYKLELIKFGDDFLTEKIALNIGNYQVTEFYVLDKDDNVIYASPMELSVLAQNVDDP